MNNKLIALAVAASVTAGLAAPLAASAAVESKWFGFTQITAESKSQDKPNDGFVFGADRVRIGYKLKDGNVFGKLQIDFNKATSNGVSGSKVVNKNGVLPEIIKDAVVGYKFSNASKVSLGQFKTPLGMDFNTSGKKLDITKRGMEKKLVLERAAGVMLSGRRIAGGFGYDIFYGNPAGRASAVGTNGTVGKDHTTVARVSYDMGKLMHVELATGKSTVNGGTDYKATDFAMAYKRGPMTGKFEYIVGKGAKNQASAKETVWLLHYGYRFNKKFEGVVRYYDAKDDATNLKLTNMYIGANIFLGSNKTNGRLQLNYVLVGGDKMGSANVYSGTAKGYTDSAILVQYQVSF
ncbi:MAG: hypothetical protein GXP11_03335 [Gammaproteobacteria bacterium]|nr:hypothetical protein [Gammaproteobacteria bacterium]